MLEVVNKNDLTNIVCLIVRYFGGIKLGSGGLIRAYANSVNECLKLASLSDYLELTTIKVKFLLSESKLVKLILNKYQICNSNNKFYSSSYGYLSFEILIKMKK